MATTTKSRSHYLTLNWHLFHLKNTTPCLSLQYVLKTSTINTKYRPLLIQQCNAPTFSHFKEITVHYWRNICASITICVVLSRLPDLTLVMFERIPQQHNWFCCIGALYKTMMLLRLNDCVHALSSAARRRGTCSSVRPVAVDAFIPLACSERLGFLRGVHCNNG